jgi:hypothetical protein
VGERPDDYCAAARSRCSVIQRHAALVNAAREERRLRDAYFHGVACGRSAERAAAAYKAYLDANVALTRLLAQEPDDGDPNVLRPAAILGGGRSDVDAPDRP